MSESRPAGPAPSDSAHGADAGHAHGQDHCHEEGQGQDAGSCGADSLRAQIAEQVAAQAALAGSAGSAGGETAEACPLPNEATDFLHWPWVWRAAQFFLVLALGWAFWLAAAKLARVCLYLSAAATVVGSLRQGAMAGMSTSMGVAGGWFTRWRAAVRMHPERFSGPLWLLTLGAIGVGAWIAGRSADAGRSLNAYVDQPDLLLIGLLAFVHFQFTAARRQPFWLLGVLAESWLIGLAAICGGMALAYGLRTGWPVVADPARAALSGWSIGYATEFAHWAALAGVLAIGRMAGDPLFRTAAADPVTAARIKATRVLLCGGQVVFAVWSVQRWLHAEVTIETIGWPAVDTIVARHSTVYAERFGTWSPFAVMAVGAGLVVLMAVCVWRALGQRLTQMRGAAPAQAAAEQESGRSVAWMAVPVIGVAAALGATQKHLAWVVVGAAGVVIAVDALLRGRGKHLRRWLALGVVGLMIGGAAWGVGSGGAARSWGMRKVWWTAAAAMITEAPGGHGFGSHIYKEAYADWWNTYGDGAEGRGRASVIPPELQPEMQPGWGERDLAFHRNWLTWELSKGFDSHSIVLQALFAGGWVWLGLLVAALGLGVWIRGGLRGGPSALVDLLPAVVLVLLLVDVPAAGLEKMLAGMIAGWVAFGCRPREAAATASVSSPAPLDSPPGRGV